MNYLVEEELEEILPKGIVPPRFCLLREGRSLLISGLAQIDLLEIDETVRRAVSSCGRGVAREFEGVAREFCGVAREFCGSLGR